jgi:hypothetical protein
MNVYIVCDFVIPVLLVILFCIKKIQMMLTYNDWSVVVNKVSLNYNGLGGPL